uniref:Uncharacterized protein n=1 Tax=Siphoviridae sp. ctWdm1 TaxID=2827883 RepID=A0A8S5RYA1_9CAUD|nr:MAG TPA: hypothetical protein [Siphoviridae sp. ctWdm1]
MITYIRKSNREIIPWRVRTVCSIGTSPLFKGVEKMSL